MPVAMERVAASLPGSFVLGDRHSSGLLGCWSRETAGTTQSSAIRFADPRSQLEVAVDVTTHPGNDALEWLVSFHNHGDSPTPLLQEIRPLDVVLPAAGAAQLAGLNGSTSALDDFLPYVQPIHAADHLHIEPRGGRSSDGAAPFFAIDTGACQIAIVIGWTGQWVVDITRWGNRIRVQAGLRDASLALLAGEAIRAPRILAVMQDDGYLQAVMRRGRAILRDHYLPQPVTPIAHMTMATFHVTGRASAQGELAAIARGAALGVEAHWVDACWYGTDAGWSEQVGNWFVRRSAFPDGLAPISAATHAAGMKFVLWVEPERARPESQLAREHPEFFIGHPDVPSSLLLNLGSQPAREHILEMLSELIASTPVDIYRQDFNMPPLAAWRANDAPGRQGITEIRHVQGLYALWDALLARHPCLVIDNCSSGGRRIDLETMRRSVSLWRSDFGDVGGGGSADTRDLANQVHIGGLSRWLWQHSGPLWSFEPYAVRSALATGVVVYRELPTSPEESQLAKAALAEVKRLRPLLRATFHELAPLSTSERDWYAYQVHDDANGRGFALFFRRRASSDDARRFRLNGLDRGTTYLVSESPGYAQGRRMTMTGSELASASIAIAEAPGSLLLEYAPRPS